MNLNNNLKFEEGEAIEILDLSAIQSNQSSKSKNSQYQGQLFKHQKHQQSDIDLRQIDFPQNMEAFTNNLQQSNNRNSFDQFDGQPVKGSFLKQMQRLGESASFQSKYYDIFHESLVESSLSMSQRNIQKNSLINSNNSNFQVKQKQIVENLRICFYEFQQQDEEERIVPQFFKIQNKYFIDFHKKESSTLLQKSCNLKKHSNINSGFISSINIKSKPMSPKAKKMPSKIQSKQEIPFKMPPKKKSRPKKQFLSSQYNISQVSCRQPRTIQIEKIGTKDLINSKMKKIPSNKVIHLEKKQEQKKRTYTSNFQNIQLKLKRQPEKKTARKTEIQKNLKKKK